LRDDLEAPLVELLEVEEAAAEEEEAEEDPLEVEEEPDAAVEEAAALLEALELLLPEEVRHEVSEPALTVT
jgi:hypothetical protein